jgi:predicted TPR repeat methyltransferase
MKPLQTSSGDPSADRRADYAEMLYADGDHAAAAALLLDALELTPRWVLGWFRLGEMQQSAGAPELAAQAWSMALQLDPSDRYGAALNLQLIGKESPSGAVPSAFAETLFDHYAGSFDEALVARLDYRLPELLDRAIRAAGPGRFGLVLDLGCGTGLMGQRLRPIADRLEGYDISSGMLSQARAKGIYDYLGKADLRDFSYAGPKADLVTAADVFIYVGALESVVKTIAGLLADGGVFAFSVERLDGEGDFVLQSSRRYAHAPRYVREVLAANGLELLSMETVVIRQDRREPVAGLALVAARLPAGLDAMPMHWLG